MYKHDFLKFFILQNPELSQPDLSGSISTELRVIAPNPFDTHSRLP